MLFLGFWSPRKASHDISTNPPTLSACDRGCSSPSPPPSRRPSHSEGRPSHSEDRK